MNQTPVSLNFSAHGTASGTPWRAVAGRSRVAVICASWHTDVVHQARDSMAAELQAQGVAAQNISHFNVPGARSEEHTSELQSQSNLVCRLLLEKKKTKKRHRE